MPLECPQKAFQLSELRGHSNCLFHFHSAATSVKLFAVGWKSYYYKKLELKYAKEVAYQEIDGTHSYSL